MWGKEYACTSSSTVDNYIIIWGYHITLQGREGNDDGGRSFRLKEKILDVRSGKWKFGGEHAPLRRGELALKAQNLESRMLNYPFL